MSFWLLKSKYISKYRKICRKVCIFAEATKNHIDMSEKKVLSKSAAVISKTMYAAMKLLKENGGSMPFSELRVKVGEAVEFTEWERSAPSENTHKPRWEVNMTFYSVDYTKAGFLTKDSGVWYLTEQGEKMLSQSAEDVFAAAHTAYRLWAHDNAKYGSMDDDVKEVTDETPSMTADDAESEAMDGLRHYLTTMDWRMFQDMVAALLRGMGYYVPFVAPQGSDGGIDVLAYETTSGAGQRLIVQVKRFKDTSVSVDVIRNTAALLHKDTDTGMVITTGRFTKDAIMFAQGNKHNLRLIDLNEFINLWIHYYDRLSVTDKALMPLKAVYYLAR